EREHGRGMAGLDETLAWLAANSLHGRVGGDQFGVLGLDLLEFVDEFVEFSVADLGIVENVVAVFVVADLVAQGFDLLLDCCRGHVRGNYSARLTVLSSRFWVLSLEIDLLLLRFPNSPSSACSPSHA